MTSERWRQVEALYHSASEREPSQRSAFLDEACRGDEELRGEVESLLAQESSPGALLERPVWDAAAPSSASVAPGTQLGSYRIEAILGEGGMGVVYRAFDTRLDRRVAIKVCAARFSERFDREARALAALSHPHICTLFDVGPDYLVMELLDGKTLTRQIAQGPLETADVLRFGWQIADALAEAHGAGIVHRDLKPGNIMLTRRGVKVLDFGLAKVAIAEALKVTQTGALMGTPAYMAPEQMEGKEADARSDLFALGVILYEMASGQLPFPGASLGSMLTTGIVSVPPLSRLRHGLPAGLDALIVTLLEPDPAKRPQSAALIRDQLQKLASNPKTNFKALIGAAVLLLVLLAGGVLWMLRRADNNSAMPGPVTEITPVTSYLGDEREASLSPDGNQVAFSWNGEKGDNRDIYVKQIGGQTPLRLTQDPAEDNYPAWSPDGSQIAFLRQRDADHWEIELVSSLGGPERKLYQVSLNTTFLGGAHPLLAWGPDGKQIVFTQAYKETVGRLYVLSLETGLAHLLQLGSFHDIFYDSSPSISPDGRRLAFTRFSGLSNGILMEQRLRPGIEPAGEPTVIPGSGPYPSSPCWSPDGKRLVFADRHRIFAWEVGGSVRPIYTASEALGGLTATWRTGHLRAITASRSDNSYIWALPIDPVTHTVSGPAVPRIRSSARNDSPRFSPDGRTLAFRSNRGGFGELWLADADGKNQRQLTRLDAYITGYPRWSPDGKQITFHARLPEVPQVYVVDADGGVPRKVTSAAFGFFAPIWAMDGKHLFATGKADGKDEVFRIGVADGKTEPLFGASESAPTSDGKRILYGKVMEPGIFSRALEGDPSRNPEERLVDDFIVLYGSMLPVPSGIYYTGFTPQGKPTAFRFFDYATHRSKDIAPAPFGVGSGLTLPPDQHELLYSALNDSSGADLLLLEFQ
jgi:eukaryotic-like serine/threonine-protein kinase